MFVGKLDGPVFPGRSVSRPTSCCVAVKEGAVTSLHLSQPTPACVCTNKRKLLCKGGFFFSFPPRGAFVFKPFVIRSF